MLNDYIVLTVRTDEIDSDDHFRISRNSYSSELDMSLKQAGMIEKPFLIKRDGRYYPLNCHNRLSLVKSSGIESVSAFILDKPCSGVFINNVTLKIFRNEVGPVGRLRALHILSEDFGKDEKYLADFAKKNLKIPQEIYSDKNYILSIMKFPALLLDYIDSKDISFKVIRDLASLDESVLYEISRWLRKIQVRVNIFKMLADIIFDVVRRDGRLDIINDENLDEMDDRKLYEHLFRIRYPEYASKKRLSEQLIAGIVTPGVAVEFPEFFERGSISFKITVSKKDRAEKLNEIASGIDVKKIKELLALL